MATLPALALEYITVRSTTNYLQRLSLHCGLFRTSGSTAPCPLWRARGRCYRAGTPCPDNNGVCGEEFCNIQMWRDIVSKLKPDGVTNVKVVSYIETMTTTLDEEGTRGGAG